MDRVLKEKYPGDSAKQKIMREGMAKLDRQLDAEQELAKINRRTMVTPAPAGFKPEPVARKIRLKLVLEKKTIRVGEYLSIRLELTNVGREAIDYQELERSIFVKGGGLSDSLKTLYFYRTDSKGKREELMPLMFGAPSSGAPSSHRPTPFPSGMSEADKEKLFQEISATAGAGSDFQVKLLPGETLHSLGNDGSPGNSFKPLYAKGFRYGEPGIYRLHLELDDRPGPLDKDLIEHQLSFSTLEEIQESHAKSVRKALGPVSSNAVTFEVTR